MRRHAHARLRALSSSAALEPGTLYVVATPIGNLEDITLRALRVLRSVDVILAEDTRHTLGLLRLLELPPPPGGLHALHDHNEGHAAGRVLDWLRDGRAVALVSDAGTPAISDPGYRLVAAAREDGRPVVAVPGPCAAIAALSAAGLPTDRFTFVGFPPKKAGALDRFFDELEGAVGTLVMYAAAREVPELLEVVARRRGDPLVAAYRELTKTFEELSRGSASLVAADWTKSPRKGEVTVLVAPSGERAHTDEELLRLLSASDVDSVRAATGVSRKRLYALKLSLKDTR